MKKIVGIASLVIVVISSFAIGFVVAPDGYTGATEYEDATFMEIYNMLLQDHFSQPSEEELNESALLGLISGLGDPHTTYFDFDQYSDYRAKFGETYVGIGVSVSYTDGLIIVEEVKKDGPADSAGFLPNDIIAFVDFEDIKGIDFYDVVGKIVGEEGTTVTVGVIRAGFDNPIHFEMTRATIDNSSVSYMTITKNAKKIGYIEVSTFGDETATKFREAVADLESQDIDGIVVDLRNNGGGHLSTVINMLRVFLVDNGKQMFSTEYYLDGEYHLDPYMATNDSKKDYEIVTLINENSASASEVFASAMKEHGGYPLVGMLTYGKGTMQTDRILETTCIQESAIKLNCDEADRIHISFGRWLTSDGNWVHFDGGTDGITPDIEVIPTTTERAYKLFLFDDEVLVFDQVDSRVNNVQLILNTMGYNLRTDGYFGQATKDAVLEIQLINGIPQTGNIDSATLVYINEALDLYQDNLDNDSQLQEALDYFNE